MYFNVLLHIISRRKAQQSNTQDVQPMGENGDLTVLESHGRKMACKKPGAIQRAE